MKTDFLIILFIVIILFKITNHIENFDILKSNIIKINNSSYNSFIYKIEYKKNKYYILKSNIGTNDEDNLYYEYLVGLFINKQINKFPCFIRTFDLFLYKNEKFWNIFRNSVELNSNMLKKGLIRIKDKNINNINCNKYYGLLLEYVNNSISLKSKLEDIDFINNELMNVLFQIYFPLKILNNVFSHNDLNYNNILLEKISDNKYIELHYIFNDNTEIKFKTQYIAKIIDYGNTYYNENDNNNTLKIYEKICLVKDCDNDCHKYKNNMYYKKYIIENYLMDDIIIYFNENNINNENIHFIRTINDKDLNIIYDKILNYLKNNNIPNNYFNKYKKSFDLYIYENKKNMKKIKSY
jgi:hypothetical protein